MTGKRKPSVMVPSPRKVRNVTDDTTTPPRSRTTSSLQLPPTCGQFEMQQGADAGESGSRDLPPADAGGSLGDAYAANEAVLGLTGVRRVIGNDMGRTRLSVECRDRCSIGVRVGFQDAVAQGEMNTIKSTLSCLTSPLPEAYVVAQQEETRVGTLRRADYAAAVEPAANRPDAAAAAARSSPPESFV